MLHIFFKLLRITESRGESVKSVVATLSYKGLLRLAQLSRRFSQGSQNALQVESRAANDLQHVSSSCLLLKRFAQLTQQARVLDSDDGLRGEVLYQLDLLIAEWTHLLAVNDNCADHLTVFDHGNADQTSRAGNFDRGLAELVTVSRERRNIREMKELLHP